MQWTAVEIARATWTHIAEPGDAAAAKLIKAVGPERALEIAGGDELTFDEKDRLQGWFTQSELDHGLARWTSRFTGVDSLIDHRLSVLDKLGGWLLTPEGDDWPSQLNDLAHPPYALWVRGNGRLPEFGKLVAVVGSRDATEYGAAVTADFARALADRGYTVVSGGAYGVDAHAHRAALSAFRAYGGVNLRIPTIAVLASGVDRFYPNGNSDLFEQLLAQGGSIISEIPPGAAPIRSRFLQRNRIIAALSTATVVIEARWRSGALNTIHHARELNRVTFAVPGSVFSANSAGTHRLIRDESAELCADPCEMFERI